MMMMMFSAAAVYSRPIAGSQSRSLFDALSGPPIHHGDALSGAPIHHETPKTLPPQSRQLLAATTVAAPREYPGRPVGVCTSRGHMCASLITNKPFHVRLEGKCETARSKTLRDRFGRPLTIRYTYNKKTYVANREQVCDLRGNYMSSNRSRDAEHIDDLIWKNLSIWSKEFEHKWEQPAAKAAYIKCHALFASFHCSAMFPNCTAEFLDKKPSMPCKELCEDTMKQCSWGRTEGFFLPYKLLCKAYPSRADPWKKCTHIKVTEAYSERVAGVSTTHNLAIVAAVTLAWAFLETYR